MVWPRRVDAPLLIGPQTGASSHRQAGQTRHAPINKVQRLYVRIRSSLPRRQAQTKAYATQCKHPGWTILAGVGTHQVKWPL